MYRYISISFETCGIIYQNPKLFFLKFINAKGIVDFKLSNRKNGFWSNFHDCMFGMLTASLCLIPRSADSRVEMEESRQENSCHLRKAS